MLGKAVNGREINWVLNVAIVHQPLLGIEAMLHR